MNILIAIFLTVNPFHQEKEVQILGFTFTQLILSVDSSPADIEIIDLNKDGNLDLVIANDDLNIFLFDGIDSFSKQAGHGLSPGENPVDLTSADFDTDGNADLAIANHDVKNITLLFGDGVGSFTVSRSVTLNIDVDPHPHAVWSGDLDSDGNIDLLVDDRNR